LLEDLGNLGDFVGGIAVVVTLIYLAFQIRQNTTSVEAATIQAASQAFAEIVDSFARDPELITLFLKGSRDYEILSPEERQRFAAIMGSMLHRFEGLVILSDRGLLPPRSWDGAVNRLRGTFALPGTLAWWNRGSHVFNSRLQTWVEEEVIGKPARPPDAGS
jgi:hypothetical protein